MATRKRRPFARNSSETRQSSRDRLRRTLLEKLEQRQLLAAGPQLIGIQPNEGALIENDVTQNVAPRVLTFRFDDGQVIHPSTLDSIQITRAGQDGALGTSDDVRIEPGSVSVGSPNGNEVLVRFADSLPDDRYRIEVFAFDDPASGIVGLRNTAADGTPGQLLVPRGSQGRSEVREFDLQLGALVESVVPQPVVRMADGTLQQRRDQVVVYFNEPLFIENLTGTTTPSDRSGENPRFYQLLYTRETVSNTDDTLFLPTNVRYDAASQTATLTFAKDLEKLIRDNVPNGGVGGGTYRLRVGSAVNLPAGADGTLGVPTFDAMNPGNSIDLFFEPDQSQQFIPSATSTLRTTGDQTVNVKFTAVSFGQGVKWSQVRFVNSGAGGLAISVTELANNFDIVVDLGGASPLPTVQQLVDSINSADPLVSDGANLLVTASIVSGDGTNPLGAGLAALEPIRLLGDSFSTAYTVGTFGGSQVASLLFNETVDAVPYTIDLAGGPNDPASRDLIGRNAAEFASYINASFTPDVDNQVKLISYNFGAPGAGLVNSITDQMKQRVRESLDLWSQNLGVRFVETNSAGWTIALETPSSVPANGRLLFNQGRAAVVPDETYNGGLLVLDALFDWQVGYGEDFFRTAFAGVGALLGLGQASDLPASTVMALSNAFLNGTINQNLRQQVYNQVGNEFLNRELEPVFPANYDVLHGQFLHGAVGSDIDLYRFVVDVSTGSNTGVLTAETFAQRLPDSSALDTSLKLFQETQASVETNFSLPVAPVRIEAVAPGRLGNQIGIEFVREARPYTPPSGLAADDPVEIARQATNVANFQITIVQRGVNSFEVVIPQLPDLSLLTPEDRAAETDQLAKTPKDILEAISADAFASSLVRVVDLVGDNFASMDDYAQFESIFSLPELPFRNLVLGGGDIVPIAFNDDYFGTDSRIQTTLGDGVYYVGVSASGNDQYDPVIPGTGFGGRSEGDYQLFLKFEATADGRDTLRDVDGDQPGVPGTTLDGDGDGIPGGANNFWFQVRPESRQIAFDSGSLIVPGQTLAVTAGVNGVTRTYQFIEVDALGGTVPNQPSLGSGRIAIRYSDAMPPAQVAAIVASAINGGAGATGVSAGQSTELGRSNILTLMGERSISLSSDFSGATVFGRTIFVDKTAGAFPTGTVAKPFDNIAGTLGGAFGASLPNDIVRIVGNGGTDRNIATATDNFAYQIGVTETGGTALVDGRTMDVPMGVTVMVDAGAVFKLRNSRIGVGSSNLQVDRSEGAIQVLGTPRLLDATGALIVNGGQPASGSVVFTSTRDQSVARSNTGGLAAGPGDWGGIVLRRDVDDQFGRANLEDQGIFLQYVNFADIRFGGGSSVVVDADQVTVNPIQIVDTKPTVTFNRITSSADAAMSAAPNSFEEISYQSPRYQGAGAFTADYDRVGPDIRRNSLSNNTLNGLFIRVETESGSPPVVQTIAARWDDTDIVHILSENLSVSGSAGGALRDEFMPNLNLLTSLVTTGSGNVAAGSYQYRLTMVDRFGFESLPSAATAPITVATNGSLIQVSGLARVPTDSDYRFRRLYRSLDGGAFELVTELNAVDIDYVDRLNQSMATSVLDLARTGERGRPAASLVIDPNSVVKVQGSRIEVGFGAQLLAEGVLGKEVIFTSISDDRYGAGGSFDTNNDAGSTNTAQVPTPGDWAGIYGSPSSHISLDSAVVAYAGGLSRIEGTFKAFNPIELQQSTARIVNTVFENNANGIGGQGPTGRFGRLANTPATIFARGSQPIIVGNTFTSNAGSVIDIDVNSLNADLNVDIGRQTGSLDRITGLDDNRGPLVRRNALDDNDLNGMEIRGETLTTESVWDDTDIVHVLYDSVVVDNFHGSGNLRLQSNPNESLVVKLLGPGSPFNDTTGTGFTITGTENGLRDRIGGSIQVLGRPGFPVVLTSVRDDSVGAGRKPDGTQQTDTNNDAFATRPGPNDWRSLFLDQTSSDRNILVVRELELQTDQSPGINATAGTAQVLGELAGRLVDGDDLRRIGFDVEGFLSAPSDVDVYQFRGEAGTEVWIDIDRTTSSLDTVVELLDSNGVVLARSTNSFDEAVDPGQIEVFSNQLTGRVGSLAEGPDELITLGSGGDYYDFDSSNAKDAGFRLILPGAVGNRGPYFVRVRSNSVDPNDAAGGLTSGSYRMQIRLGEAQEFAGSSVTYADIRYANHGIHAKGLPGTSPLLGDVQENEGVSAISSNNSIFQSAITPGSRPQYVGNLLSSTDRTVSIGGALSSAGDIDFYRVELNASNSAVNAGGVITSAVFDIDYADGISRPDTNLAIYYSPTGQPAAARLVLFGQASNIAEDQSGYLATLSENVFEAGSSGTGDPFIGPVALPEGTYYIGVTNGSQVPSVLNDTLNVRREPVNSVRRLVEERFYLPGDNAVLTSADAPVFGNFIDTGALPAGWSLDTSRAGNAGHGIAASYDGSRATTTGGRSLRFNPAVGGAPNTEFVVASREISLEGYSDADLPTMYFTYLMNGDPGDTVEVRVRTLAGTTVVASSTGAGVALQNDPAGNWRQARVSLDAFDGQDGLTIEIAYTTGGTTTGEGFYLDDVVVGLAERGEMIIGAAPGNATFSSGSGGSSVTSGQYQLEVRPATTYFSPNAANNRQITLDEAFDSNDRHARAITIVAPAGVDLTDGMRFQLGDASRILTFEFDELTAAQPSGSGVSFGNIRVPFRAIDTPAKVASALREAISAAVDQNNLRISASTASGRVDASPSDGRINLYGGVVGDFVSVNQSTAPLAISGTNRVRIPAAFFNGLGDANAERAQGQIIIDSNSISDAKVYGIWSDPGERLIDDTDDETNPFLENFGLHSPALGTVRNLPTTNESVVGGLAPGLVIQNNVIDRAGYVGIQIQGDQRPLMIESTLDAFNPDPNVAITAIDQFYLGRSIQDGVTFAIDAGGTRVVFEFEDISGANTASAGSGQVGGDGWTAGHVPVYYRKGFDAAAPYNPGPPSTQRIYPSTRMEVMHSIRDSIIGSILVTNDLIPLVDVWIGPSLITDPLNTNFGNIGDFFPLAYATPTVYINGASGIYFTGAFAKAGSAGPFQGSFAPVQEAVQPFARVINNTIYGSDGTESNFAGSGATEPSDRLTAAVDTKLGRSHTQAYTTTGAIGGATTTEGTRDIDLFRFHLDVGDRAKIDLSGLTGGLDVSLRVFNDKGEAQAFPDALGNLVDIITSDAANQLLSIDFTALEAGSYYLGVSSAGNDSYDPQSFADRVNGTGGEGTYDVSIDVLAPRTFVLSLQQVLNFENLAGTTFTIEQIADLPGQPVNTRTFEFVVGGGGATGNNIPVNILAGNAYRTSDVMRAIAAAINRTVGGVPVLPNHELQNGPFGVSGPITRVSATALGGAQGWDGNSGLSVWNGGTVGGITYPLRPHVFGPGNVDAPSGFGHNRTGQVGSVGIAGTTTDGAGTVETYVLIENAARVTINGVPNLAVDPQPGRNMDQLLPEVGIMSRDGASPTLLNNMIFNTQAAIENEVTRALGFGGTRGGNLHSKPGQVIAGGTVFQHTETVQATFQSRMTWPGTTGAGTETDAINRPSNVNGGASDFNLNLTNGTQVVLVDPSANNFLPVAGSIAIDRAINSLPERDAFASLKEALGLPVNPVLAPDRDLTGQLRVDDPNVSFTGQGSNVFKDRGAVERADFVGPVAVLINPFDNDSAGVDRDPNVSFVQLDSGVISEFRIQLRDSGDASDPFQGSGIDDGSVVGPRILDVREIGAVLTLFQDGELLVEGVDYLFGYDETNDVITLRPLAGIWEQKSVYEIELNNRDRFVVTAPAGPQAIDGEQFVIIDSAGGRVTFEFESGYQLDLPEVITLSAPLAGTGAGGVGDGDRVTIDDGLRQVTFEYNLDGGSVTTGNVPVAFTLGDSGVELTTSLRDAIQSKIDDGTLTRNVPGFGNTPTVDLQLDANGDLRIGMEAGGIVNASASGLLQASRTIAFQVPIGGVGPSGVVDGDTFVVTDGLTTITFEFENGGGVTSGNTAVDLLGITQPRDVILAIVDALNASGLRARTEIFQDNLLHLGLPAGGNATIITGRMAAVSLARTVPDAGLLTLSPAGGTPVSFEFNRTDEVPADDGVASGNRRVDLTRTTSADELAVRLATLIRAEGSLGVDPVPAGGGVVTIGGDASLALGVTGAPSVLITGTPGVTDNSTLRIFGALILQTPLVGGNGVPDGTRFSITANGITQEFEFNLQFTPAGFPNAITIDYTQLNTSDELAALIQAAINGSALGINATTLAGGRVNLGPLADGSVDLIDAPLTLRRGVVSDGEIVRITQGGQTFVFEFEEAVGGGGVVPGSIPVLFTSNDTSDQVADSLAGAITNAGGIVGITATSIPGGLVRLNDTPQTIVDISAAPTLSLQGVAGGAIPVSFVQAQSFDSEDMKQAIIEAINAANASGATTLFASDRGGDTFFVENAISIEQPFSSFFLPAVKDKIGQPLKANRENGTTRFTLMLPTVLFDYGDAPDPQNTIRGRYPTSIESDGARHVFGVGPVLGSLVDAEPNGQPLASASGDDAPAYFVSKTGTTLDIAPSTGPLGALQINVASTLVDGDTIRIATVWGAVTFELDSDNIFSEDNVPVRFVAGASPESVASALAGAIRSSALRVSDASVTGTTVSVIADDDDGVSFASDTNPLGVFNPNITTEITVNITGVGFLSGWVDFNADGDWDDPGEQIIINSEWVAGDTQRTFLVPMPSTAPVPATALETYARFRVSSQLDLRPSGLAIDGEVEDYLVRIVPGSPPVISNTALNYSVDEDQRLIGLDQSGGATLPVNDNGLLAGIVDPDGDTVIVYPTPDVENNANGLTYQIVGLGTSQITVDGTVGGEVAGTLTLESDGRFTFDPVADYFGTAIFRVRVQDSKPGQPELELVAPQLMTVTINVNPVNDRPTLINPANNTVLVTDLPEDQVLTLTAADLITGRFQPGPANESMQGMVVQSAGFGGVANVTQRGGSIQITASGEVLYTPPTDFNGPGTDSFTYSVVDIPGAGQAAQQSTQMGTVVISFVPVNDPPTAGADSYNGVEDTPLNIPVNGATGILGNDSPGPADEVAEGQFVSLVSGQFPITTVRGGTVTLSADGNTLLYTPSLNFSGSDTFQYQITDNAAVGAATQFGSVTVFVEGVNDGAIFGGPASLTYNESKGQPQVFEIDLNTWFTDPEGDALSYTVVSSDESLVNASRVGNVMTLVLPVDASGDATLTITATNPGGVLPVQQIVPVTVVNTPDPPRVIQSLNPTNTNEDQNVVLDLTEYFEDPDGDVLTYTVVTPTGQTEPFDRSLVQSVTFNGDQMTITLVPDASGSTSITLRVSDGTFAITETFTLAVAAQADVPVARNDAYNVAIQGRLVVVDRRLGLLANDSEADGDVFTVDPTSVTQPANGSVQVNADGTFTYVNLRNSVVGATDTFTYRAIDKDGRSLPATVTITLVGSTLQNPSNRLDVNADGNVSAIDALRVVNLLNRSNSNAIPIRDLPAPPDFFDVDGSGTVAPIDALAIINFLNRSGSGTTGGEGESDLIDLRMGITTTWVSAGTANLPQSSVVGFNEGLGNDDDAKSCVPAQPGDGATNWKIVDGLIEGAVDSLVYNFGNDSDADEASTDAAIESLLAEFDFSSFDE